MYGGQGEEFFVADDHHASSGMTKMKQADQAFAPAIVVLSESVLAEESGKGAAVVAVALGAATKNVRKVVAAIGDAGEPRRQYRC